jgi:hypothetical protein
VSSNSSSSKVFTLYDVGNNPIADENILTGATHTYVWSAAGTPRLILRDTYTEGSTTPTGQYLLTDRDNSTTTLIGDPTAGTWIPQERYDYTPDGLTAAYQANGSSWSTTSHTAQFSSQFGMDFLWHGERFISLYTSGETLTLTQIGPTLATLSYGGGLYVSAYGGGWYDPQHQRLLAPSSDAPASNPYDPYNGETGVEGWVDRHSGAIATGLVIAYAIGATIATGGVLAPEAAETVSLVAGLSDLALTGAAGGTVGAFGSSYAAGNSWGQIGRDTAIGAVAGAAGGVVGGSVAGQFCPAAVEGWVASGVAGGAAAGAVQGGYNGYQTGGWGGVAGGALTGALTGGAIGGVGALAAYGVFNSLGLLDGYTCFVDGTPVHRVSGQRAIEDVVLGQRAATPWTKDESWSGDGDLGVIDTTHLRAVKLRLIKRGHRNGQIDIALLRHTSWLRENNAREGAVIRLVMKEMHVDDDVEVISIEPCPEIECGGGQLVTGTFSHMAEDVLNVKLVGFDQPLGVTSQHRIFELEGEAFLEAAKLLVGQRLQTKTGDVVIETIEERPGTFRVHNIEVKYEHVYYAGEPGILVHNQYSAEEDANIAIRYDEEYGSDAYEEHHSDPEFMGGDPNQDTTTMEATDHDELHSEMYDHLEDYVNGSGNNMRPASGNTAEDIQLNFTRDERLEALADFYNRADVQGRWPEATNDFFVQHPQLKG